MKKNFTKPILNIFLCLLCLALIAYIMIHDYRLALPISDTVLKISALSLPFFVALLCINTNFHRFSFKEYEIAWSQYVGNAFKDNYFLRRKLFRAIKAYSEGFYQKSLRLLQTLLSRARSDLEIRTIWFFAAMNYAAMYFYEDAIELYNKLLTLNPDHIEANNNLGILYQDIGDHEHAILYLRRAVSLDPTRPVTYNNLAFCYLEEYDVEHAAQCAVKSLELEPMQYEAPALLAVVYALTEQEQEQEFYYQMAIDAGQDPCEFEEMLLHFTETEEEQ